jgi:type I restriction enzyme S subunit
MEPDDRAAGGGATAMNAERLLEHFDRLAEAPGAIPRLRRFILDLAARGKLVHQKADDEPASMLHTRLVSALAKSQEAERMRARKVILPSASRFFDDIPFPSSWVLTNFDTVNSIVSGVAKGKDLRGVKTERYPYLRVANVQRGYLDLGVVKDLEIRVEEFDRYRLRKGDVLMTEGGDWDKLGRAAIWNDEVPNCIHQNHIYRIRSACSEDLLPEWLVLFANSPSGRSYFENASKQTTNLASINMTQLRSCPLPLPPVAEQHRILAKVDVLMALCDRLEAAQAERERRRDRLAATSLHRLNQPAEDATAFREHACFNLQQLPRLTIRSKQLAQLSQTILNLAVRGKLVP